MNNSNNVNNWTQWVPPYDPRRVNGATVIEDRHGRFIETADCGHRCPGCGICCAGHRDTITADYAGEEEFEPNLKPGRGGLVKIDEGTWYRAASCGEQCPGYGQCCPPFAQRQFPETVADAHRLLLESETAQRWEIQAALLILAHAGSREAVEILQNFIPHAHTKLIGFAELALEEGRYFASVPNNPAEALVMMKKEVLTHWENRMFAAQSKIEDEIEPELEKLRYEHKITQQLLARAPTDTAQQNWQIQVDVLHMALAFAENNMTEQKEDVALCEAMVTAIEADLEIGATAIEQQKEGK